MANDLTVALYLENKDGGKVDVSRPELGNPGMGGTQFNFVTLAYYLNKLCGFKVSLLANRTEGLPPNVSAHPVASIGAAIDWCQENAADILVYRPVDSGEYVRALKAIEKIRLRSIAWAHNTPFLSLKKIQQCDYVKRMVCVSVEQYDMLRDHGIVRKSHVILNGFDGTAYSCTNAVPEDRIVTYIGGLTPAKGFHVLARKWPDIVSRVPDARLQVIGTGRLYDRNATLGPLGVADSRYEAKFIAPYLCAADGTVLDSVAFLGLLGQEKKTVIRSTRVGVVNPTGKTENCPGSAIEFQASGTPVVSCARWGLFDTVAHNETGYLARDYDEFADAVIRLLLDDDERNRLGANGPEFIRKKFDYQTVCQQWIGLFRDVAADKPGRILPISQNPAYKAKRFREKLRRVKMKLPFLWPIVPSYAGLRIAGKRMARLLRRGGLFRPL